MTKLGCAAVSDVAAELALDPTSEGHHALRRHIASCERCRSEVDGYACVLESMLNAVPGRDPPVSLPAQVLARIREREGSHGVFVRRLTAVAAAVVLVAGTAFAVHRLDAARNTLSAEYVQALQAVGGKALRAAPLRGPDGRTVGDAFVYEGRRSWVCVMVDDLGEKAPATLEVVAPGREPVHIASFEITGHDDYRGYALHAEEPRLSTVRLIIGPDSYEARLPD